MVSKNSNLEKRQKIIIYIKENIKYIEFIPIELLNNKKEIDDLIETLEDGIIFFIYRYRNNIESILYISEENIEIKYSILKGVKDYFYLSLLIRDNEDIINYVFEIILIRKINQENKKVKLDISNILISKIILELIDNYEQTQFFEESEKNELNEMEYFNKDYIKKNLDILKDLCSNFNIDYIINTSIDVIYIDIINNLIETKKICDDECVQRIIKQLDLENIFLTKIMLIKLSDTLNNSEQIKKNYEITNFNDLLEFSKINFYYVLFKYILKNTFYKYQIKFLIDMTRKTRNLIKNNFQPFNEEKIDKIKEKFNIFIISMTDSQYYLNLLYKKNNKINNNSNKSNNNDNDNNNNNNNIDNSNFSTCLNSCCSKQNCIKQKEFDGELIKFAKKILNSSNFLIKNNENGELLLSILNDDQKDNIENFEDIDIDVEKLKFNVNKFIDFLILIKDKIKDSFNNKFNLIIKIKTFNTSYNLNSNGTYNIDCLYIFYSPKDDSKSSFKDDNILLNGINGKCQGFYYFINEITDDCYHEILFNSNLNINDYMNKIDKLEDENKKKVDEENKKENPPSLTDIGKLSGVEEIKVLEMKAKLDKNLDSVDFLVQLSNGFFIAGEEKCQLLFIYDEDYKYIKQIDLQNYPINVSEINNDKEYLKIVVFFRKKQYILISLNKFDFTYKTECYDTNSYIFLVLSNNNYIYNDEKGTFLSTNNLLGNNSFNEEEKISKYSYKHGIEIDKNLILLISSNIFPDGKDKLIIYDKLKRENVSELEGYSFNISKNSLYLMKNREYKIVVCACKKNTKYQKNGILLVNTHIEDNQEIFECFYDTYSFEPYCFCELKYIYKKEKEIKKFETFYFLVGGFNTIKGIGVLKLYKIIYEYKAYNTKIEYIDDISFEHDNFLGFEGPITSLVQSRKTGEILVSCRYGNIYLLSPPNLNYFLYYDEQETQQSCYIKQTLFNNEPEKKIDDKINQIDNQKMFNFLLERIGRKI